MSIILASCGAGQTSGSNAIPEDKAVENKVESVLKKMTLEEKVGQMIQLTAGAFCTDDLVDTAKVRHLVKEYKIGSFLNTFGPTSRPRAVTAEQIKKIQDITMEELGIPMVYGLDMIHGASYLDDATFYPQEVNLAATFDRSYAEMMGKVIAYESRAAMTPWVFSPVMDLSRNPSWPRVWESWGEDPYLQSEMSVAEVIGAQGSDPNHIGLENVAVSIKHYLGYGAAATGKDRTPAYIAPDDLREKYFRPFKDCMQAGALTMMVNSASINSVPVHASHEYLTEWAKEQLKWDGMAVTDWADINNLYTREHIAADRKEAVALGINAGIDMIMDPYDPEVCKDIIAAVNEKMIPMSRIDDAVRRVLRLKVRLGLFENPVWNVNNYDKFACKEFQDNSYDAAVESMVLLKNEDNVLPISAGKKILVVGPNANSMRTLNGGWSYTWQGDADKFASQYNTIFEALQKVYGEKNVSYVAGVNYNMASGKWDKETDIEPLAKAVVDIMLPGNYGGDALASLISGKENFSGRLPFTYSKYVNSLHTYDYKVSENVQTMDGLYNYDATMDVHWPFGAGLSYTSFEYSGLKSISPVQFNADDMLTFEVTVKNTGSVKGKEAVLLFSSDIIASKVPDVKRLRQFTKVELNPGESKIVRLEIPAHELAFVGHDGKWRLEKGQFRIACGSESMMIDCTETKVWDTPNID